MTDCIYYNGGKCAKGLPNTPCERKGCVAYYPKDTAYACENKCCHVYARLCFNAKCSHRIPPLKDKKK